MSAAVACAAVAVLMWPRGGAGRRLERLVARGGWGGGVSPDRWWWVLVGVAIVGAAVLGVGVLIAAVLVAGTLGVRVRQLRRDRRRCTECRALAGGLEVVIGELRVGAHPSAAAAAAADETDGVAARAFAASAARSRLGGSAAEGLRVPRSVVAAELGRIADAWQVAEQHGLALADLLDAARSDLLARMRFRDRTTAALAGPRASAAVLAGLPLLGITLGQLMGAAPLSVLLTSAIGTVLLPLGTALACLGLLWTDSITRKALI
ncbi:type II secretion system F family protein [Nocardia transvalensis]|uniref:type II secretion system F family protein n=1 Tax=Nocardia transvalensis TaxID=37333 RepID=UPI0018932723|nr:type II secretion system F family protein [Nocardia transvalensis]MBF6333940.1 type II secretion system F family protein [Nocardia transvalensis]